MSLLSQVQVRRGMLSCIIGAPGTGKSSFGAEFPGVEAIIDPRDPGLLNLASEGVVPLGVSKIHIGDSFENYKSKLTTLIAGPAKTILCESITGIEHLCIQHTAKVHYGGVMDQVFYRFQDGPRMAANTYFAQLLDIMLLGQSADKHVLLTGHTDTKSKPNVTGEDYLSEVLLCEKAFGKKIGASFMNIFHIADIPDTMKSGTVKAQAIAKRVMFLSQNPQFFAKNQMGLGGPFTMPYGARAAYIAWCEFCKRDPKTAYRLSA